MEIKDRATVTAPAVAVIGVGLPRTGTASLQAALDELGFGPCYHMFELIRRPRRAPLWLAAAEGQPVDWAAVLAGYRSTVDFPGAYFWRDLVAACPEAKVVLTLRDPDRWFASVLHMAKGGRSMRVMTSRPVLFLVPVLRPLTRLMERMTRQMLDVDAVPAPQRERGVPSRHVAAQRGHLRQGVRRHRARHAGTRGARPVDGARLGVPRAAPGGRRPARSRVRRRWRTR
jgi:Sulfotransferase domain